MPTWHIWQIEILIVYHIIPGFEDILLFGDTQSHKRLGGITK